MFLVILGYYEVLNTFIVLFILDGFGLNRNAKYKQNITIIKKINFTAGNILFIL